MGDREGDRHGAPRGRGAGDLLPDAPLRELPDDPRPPRRIDDDYLREVLVESWRRKAPKRVLKEFDAAQAT
jgi:hypothetical protein